MTHITRPLHLAWQIKPWGIAAPRLQKAGFLAPDDSANDLPKKGMNIALLYGWTQGSRPAIVSWLLMFEGARYLELARPDDGKHSLGTWLEQHRDADVWTIATTWHFYHRWASGGSRQHWRASLFHEFSPHPLLDPILQQSGGFLIWEHQLEQLILMTTDDLKQARELVRALRGLRSEAFREAEDLRLPDGSSLIDLAIERNRSIAGSLDLCRPDFRTAANLLLLLQKSKNDE